MLELENVSTDNMPEWLKKCICCTHAYSTQSDDMEIKCRCRKGCNFKQAKNSPIYKK